MRRIVVGSLLAVFVGLSSLASAADIIWVHQFRGGGDGENNPGRGEGSLSWEDDQWRQLIEGQGHSIISNDFYDDYETLSQEEADARIDAFNAADLVIVSRDSNSGDYNDESEHIFFTEEFQTPMIVMTPYLLRSSRWDMVASTAIQDAMNPMVAEIPDHPIFEGVTLTDGMVDFWSQLGENDHIDLVNTTDFGFAEVIATEAETDIPWIAYWEGDPDFGAEFYDGSRTFGTGPRLYLSAGSDDDPNTWGEKNITEAGDQIVLNAIAWLTGDPGNPIDVCTPGNGDIDGNGAVEFADFLILSGNFGQAADAAGGDIDCNGTVEFADFLVLSGNFGQNVGAASVPEPSSMTILGLGVLFIGTLRRRR